MTLNSLGAVLDAATLANLQELGPDALRLWRLASTPASHSVRTSLLSLKDLIDRADLNLAALESAPELDDAGRAVAKMANTRAKIQYALEEERLRAQLAMADERDRLQEGRPEGCTCLGLGGTGRLLLLGGRRCWSRWCSCPEATGMLAEYDRAAAEADERERAAADRALQQEAVAAMARRTLLANLPGEAGGRTWDDFLGSPAARIVPLLRSVASGEWAGRVMLHGDFGRGKSTLAALAVRDRLARGDDAIFVTLADYLQALRPDNGLTPPLSRAQVGLVRSAALAVVDDVGAERLTAWGRDATFRLLQGRLSDGLTTIVTSNYGPDELAGRLAWDADIREGRRIVERIVNPPAQLVEVLGRNYRHG